MRHIATEVEDALALEWFHVYELEKANDWITRAHNMMQWIINLPMGAARRNNLYMAVIIDEFQVLTKVYNPDSQNYRDVTDSFQHASETRYAPLLVSGSSLSMMIGNALGGMLSGRFQTWRLQPLTQEYAIDMALRIGQHLDLHVTEDVALALFELTQGYPYSIERILNSLSPDIQRLPDLAALPDIIFFELTNGLGALREHYEDEYGKYIHDLNGDKTTRKILFWITNYPDERIHPDVVAKRFGVDLLQVQDALEKLYRADILQRASISTFRGPSDPLMREYLKYEHYLEVDKLTDQAAEENVRRELNRQRGEMNRQIGHFSEIIVAGVMNNFNNQQVDGKTYFSHPGTVTLPRMAQIARREGVIKAGSLHEIDVVGEYPLYNQQEGNAGLGAWLVSVRYRQERMNEQEVDAFIRHVAAYQAEKQYGTMTRWYFSKAGFTTAARQKLQEEGIYVSDLEQFNALADLFGLLPLTM